MVRYSDVNEARTLEAEAEAKTLEAEAGYFGLEAEAGFEAKAESQNKIYYMFHYLM